MKIKPQTIMVAVQCVFKEIHALDARLEAGTAEDPAGTEQLLVSYDLALQDLKEAYQVACEHYAGLPPYDQLIRLQNDA